MNGFPDITEPVLEICKRLGVDATLVKHISIDRSGQVGLDMFDLNFQGNKHIDPVTGRIAMSHKILNARVS